MPPLDPKTIYLILTIVMPGQMPDVRHAEPMPSIAACEEAAHEFIARQKVPEGAQAIMGACLKPKGLDIDAKSKNGRKGAAG